MEILIQLGLWGGVGWMSEQMLSTPLRTSLQDIFTRELFIRCSAEIMQHYISLILPFIRKRLNFNFYST